MLQLVECPRDAMQGWPKPIKTQDKIYYLNTLLQVGFHTLDCGSFVSPQAIPQMADTAEVLSTLQMHNSITRLLVIVANTRGAEAAVMHENVTYIGFPFSISPTFQERNTNSTMEESLRRVDEIHDLCIKNKKQLVIYLSMGFGNPYNDEYNEEILLRWADVMATRNIKIISLADTVGMATPGQITKALNTLQPEYPETVFGVHLHSSPHNFAEKLKAALEAGCTRIDGALKGIGGCPMAKDELVGNMPMESIINYCRQFGHQLNINDEALQRSLELANEIFS